MNGELLRKRSRMAFRLNSLDTRKPNIKRTLKEL